MSSNEACHQSGHCIEVEHFRLYYDYTIISKWSVTTQKVTTCNLRHPLSGDPTNSKSEWTRIRGPEGPLGYIHRTDLVLQIVLLS